MRIDDEEYFDPTAPEGVPVRYLHKGCSDGKRDPCLVVTKTSTGWKYKCHRCGAGGYRGLDGLSTKAVMAFGQQKVQPTGEVNQITLPSQHLFGERTRIRADAWLMKYGITPAEYKRYQMYEAYKRLIIPVYEHGKVVYWQGRAFDNDLPKWINQKLIGRSNIVFRGARGSGPEVVLVEDIISAIKVNRITDAIALLGSYVPDELIMSLAEQYDTIHIWLDADKDLYSLKRMARYRAFGLPVKRIVTPLDPKVYREDQIHALIYEGGEKERI